MTCGNSVEFLTIAIDITPFNLTAYNLPAYTLNEAGNRLLFFCQPEQYQRQTTGSGYSFLATSAGRQLKIGLKEVSFAADLARPEIEVLSALEFLARQALQTKTPITIEDAVRPDRDDITTGVTVRQGFIFAIRDTLGALKSLAQNKILLPQGCGFTFVQTDLIEV